MAYVKFYHWSGRKRRQRGRGRQSSIEHGKKDGGSGEWKKEEEKIDVR